MFEKQNEEQFIELLFLQRRHYTFAGNWNRALWFVTVLTAVVGNNTIVNLNTNIQIFITALMSLAAWIIYVKLNKNVKLGAYTKELFDRTLFDLPLDSLSWEIKPDEIRDMAYQLRLKYPAKFNIACKNSGEDKPRGLKDWYTRISTSNHNKSIFSCQNENIWWDKKISEKYRIVLSAMAIFVLTGLLFTYYNKSLLDLIIVLFENTALVLNFIDDFLIHIKFHDHHIKMDTLIENIRKKSKPSKNDIENIQKQIFIRRSMRYLPFDFLHKINRFKFHILWKRPKTYEN